MTMMTRSGYELMRRRAKPGIYSLVQLLRGAGGGGDNKVMMRSQNNIDGTPLQMAGGDGDNEVMMMMIAIHEAWQSRSRSAGGLSDTQQEVTGLAPPP